MGKISSRMNKLEERMSKVEADNKKNIDLHIIQLLQERNSPITKNPRYRYTYQEISEMTSRSTGYISKIANRFGLSRRNFTIL